jgi:hypothetical protein
VPPRGQINFRLDERTERLLDRLERKLNLNASGVVRLALARLGELEGVDSDEEDQPAKKVA